MCECPPMTLFHARRLKSKPENMCFDTARQQHDTYTKALRSFIPAVYEVPASEEHPDCVFIEDTVVVAPRSVDDPDHTVVLFTNPGHKTRRGEVNGVVSVFEQVLSKHHGPMTMTRMKDPAQLDGGDVAFTGTEFFVGESERTNQLGIEALVQAYPSYPVHRIEVSDGLHLKSALTFVGGGLVLASHEAGKMLEGVLNVRPDISVLQVPDAAAANVLDLGNVVICRADYPDSARMISSALSPAGYQVHEVDTSELEKADGALTCCSVFPLVRA
eukprot:TRINITY_DN3091_c0_g1_i1.p1 TRINITY_DN3091_c0_g1~~TRINITY_DN3091_c0_g1_i1.p1  ORF type:complete len:273 (-),score=24.43 TRINITY_DN3091_c0_g1_i1:38-856(-)